MPSKSISHFYHGFSLLEVLIAISIISIIAFVAIPNLTSFNTNQEFLNETNSLKDILQKAQSGSRTGIRCSDSSGSRSWDVVIAANRYFLRINCVNGTTETQNNTIMPTGMTIQTPCTGGANDQLIITSSRYTTTFSCFIPITLTAPVAITLQQGTQSEVLTVNALGVVSD